MKTLEDIYQEMLTIFTQETGMTLNETSEMAVRLYAMASQVYGLYVQNQWTLAQCFPQTAQGEYLDYHAALRGLGRNKAVQAQGKLRFSVEQAQGEALAIGAGTVCMTAGLVRFETTQEALLSPGALFVDVPAQAVEAGASGNVPEGMVRVMSVPPVGIGACSNPQPFTGGIGAELDSSFRERILETYQRMPNGANAAYYEREALSFEQVTAVNVLGKNRGIGTVDVVISGPAGDPGEETIRQVKEHLQERREIAVDLDVLPPTEKGTQVAVQIAVTAGSSFDTVRQQVEQNLLAYFDGRRLGKAVLRAQLGQIVYGAQGVENYHIVAPVQDLAAVPGQLPRLSALSVEAMP